jgi:haloalkane dehalogenase
MPQSYGDRSRLTEQIHRHYLEPLEVEEERKGCWVLPGQILGATGWLGALWARRELLAMKPKLIVWGMKDIAFREKELNTWSSAFPDAEVIRLEGVGHYVQEEAVDELGPAIKGFLVRRDEVALAGVDG